MRSPLPFPLFPDRPYKILLVRVGTLAGSSFSHPLVWRERELFVLFAGLVCPFYLFITGLARTFGTNSVHHGSRLGDSCEDGEALPQLRGRRASARHLVRLLPSLDRGV